MTTKAEATKLTKTSHWDAETQMHSTGWPWAVTRGRLIVSLTRWWGSDVAVKMVSHRRFRHTEAQRHRDYVNVAWLWGVRVARAMRHPLMSPSEHMRLRVSATPRFVIRHRRAPSTGLGRHGSSAPRRLGVSWTAWGAGQRL